MAATTTGPAQRARTASCSISTLPTVFNVALSFRLNWRGNFRARSKRTEAVLLNSRLMNTTWEELLPKLRADEAYEDAFARVYRGAPAPARAGCACDLSALADHAAMGALTVTCAGSAMPSRQRRSAAISCSRIMAASPAIKASMSAAICFSGWHFSGPRAGADPPSRSRSFHHHRQAG